MDSLDKTNPDQSQANCIFCLIVAGQAPAHVVAEDDNYIAFLDLFPVTEAATVAIPKTHQDSNFAKVDPQVVAGLVEFGQKVSKMICDKYADLGRCGFVFEGYGVDHLHAKLIPLHLDKTENLKPPVTKSVRFYEKYLGFIDTRPAAEPTSDEVLSKVAAKIKSQTKPDKLWPTLM